MAESARRIPQLDGIRGTAILLVILWHFAVTLTMLGPHKGVVARMVIRGGLLTWSGVDLFFVLSGFLIGGILIDAKESPNYFKTFYLRRVFRILPIYLLLVVPYLLLWEFTGTHRNILQEMLGRPMPWYIYLTFTQNFWLAHHEQDFVYLALSWSLAVEEQFYLLLPTIVRILPRRHLLPAAISLALGAVIARTTLYLHYGPSWGEAAYTLFFSRADALMLGVICALLLRDSRSKERLMEHRWAIKTSWMAFGLGVAILIYKGWGMGTRPMYTLGLTCLALFYASSLIITMISPEGLLCRAFRIRWLMWFGTIAYGLYLVEGISLEVVFRILRHHGPVIADCSDSAASLSALIVAVVLAWLSWKHFESKLVRLGHHFTYGSLSKSRVPGPS